MSKILYFFRNANYFKKSEDLESELSRIGIDQILEIKKQLPNIFDLVISSPAKRAIMTASTISRTNKIEIIKSLYCELFALEQDENCPISPNTKPKDWFNEDGGTFLLADDNSKKNLREIKLFLDKFPLAKEIVIISHGITVNMIAFQLASTKKIRKWCLNLSLKEAEGIKFIINDKNRVVEYEYLKREFPAGVSP